MGVRAAERVGWAIVSVLIDLTFLRYGGVCDSGKFVRGAEFFTANGSK